MHKLSNIIDWKALFIIILATLAVMFFMQAVNAAEEAKTFTVDSRTDAIDKNGEPYVRFIVTEERDMNGMTYEVGIPVMAFGDTVPMVQNIQAGDQLTAVVSVQQYQGRENWRILGVKSE